MRESKLVMQAGSLTHPQPDLLCLKTPDGSDWQSRAVEDKGKTAHLKHPTLLTILAVLCSQAANIDSTMSS